MYIQLIVLLANFECVLLYMLKYHTYVCTYVLEWDEIIMCVLVKDFVGVLCQLQVSKTAEDAAKKVSDGGDYVSKTEVYQKVQEV